MSAYLSSLATHPAMSRRAHPERIFQARRDAIRNRLTDSGMSVETAERWCDAWVLEATGLGLPRDGAYWQAGWDWIVEERVRARCRLAATDKRLIRCTHGSGPPGAACRGTVSYSTAGAQWIAAERAARRPGW